MRNLSICFALSLLAAGLGLGQVTAMSSTTLAEAVALADNEVVVASATGISAYTNTVNTMLYVDREAMDVISLSGTRVTVHRTRAGSLISSHASGARVWIGPPTAFYASAPFGACTSTAVVYHPRIVVTTGDLWSCPNGQWEKLPAGTAIGTPEAGVTAYEVGDKYQRVTKLTFSGLAIGSGATADLGFGKKLYTLPDGALVITAANMNVALAGSGTGCDTDTPDGGIGTVIASGVVKVLSGTATFEDIMTGQTFNDVNGTAEVKTVTATLVRETGDAHTVHLNLADDWAGACAVTATGSVTLKWEPMP